MATASPVCTNWHPSKRHSDVERWICIYPAYINSKKTRMEGRRLPKEQCVENPTFAQIRDVLSVTHLHVTVENKQYSRESNREFHTRGRVRVQMRNDDGTPVNPELSTRDNILLYVAMRIPQLKSFNNKTSEQTVTQSQSSHVNAGGSKKHRGKRR